MALPSEYIMATVRYGVPSRPLQMNVLWYTLDGAIGGADDQEASQLAATALASAINDALAAVTTTETELIGVNVSNNNNGNVFVATGAFTSINGDVAVDTLPEYCAVIIQKRTGHAGKSGRGRWYIGCVPETFADNGTTTTVADGLYDALGDVLVNQVTAGGALLHPQLFSSKDNTFYPLVARRTVGTLGTERRRKPRPLF